MAKREWLRNGWKKEMKTKKRKEKKEKKEKRENERKIYIQYYDGMKKNNNS